MDSRGDKSGDDTDETLNEEVINKIFKEETESSPS